MATAADVINLSAGLIGLKAAEETLTAADAQLFLTVLQMMIDSWSTERLSVFCTQDQSFSWPVGQVTRTLGPTGNFVGTRPITIDDATYFVDSTGLSFPINIINEEQYNSIPLKNVTSTYPIVMWVENTFPNITMSIYPVPTQLFTWHFISVLALTQPVSLVTTMSFPPGYLRAFVFNLAVEAASHFGVDAPPRVVRIADISKRSLKRINNPGDVMSFPDFIVSSGTAFSFYSGT